MRYIFFFSLLLIVCHSASAQNGTAKDIDGNVYHVVKIGTQRWMKEQLKTAHYRDGSPIKEIKLKDHWSDSSESKTGACYYYDSHRGNNHTYGQLYNWYAVVDPRHLCPAGWHVPSDSDWTVLTGHLGDTVTGGKMNTTTLRKSPNTSVNNSSGSTAQPAGGHYGEEEFGRDGYYDKFWSSTEAGSNSAWFRCLFFINSPVYGTSCRKEYPLSVRCVGD